MAVKVAFRPIVAVEAVRMWSRPHLHGLPHGEYRLSLQHSRRAPVGGSARSRPPMQEGEAAGKWKPSEIQAVQQHRVR